jgi:hypothetical protein
MRSMVTGSAALEPMALPFSRAIRSDLRPALHGVDHYVGLGVREAEPFRDQAGDRAAGGAVVEEEKPPPADLLEDRRQRDLA